MTRETVLIDTSASLATSWIVGRFLMTELCALPLLHHANDGVEHAMVVTRVSDMSCRRQGIGNVGLPIVSHLPPFAKPRKT